MVKTLSFDKNFKAKETGSDFDFNSKSLQWVNFSSSASIERILARLLGKGNGFIEDLLEEQRPNITQHDEFSVIVLSFPSKKEDVLQLTLIVSKSKVITITSKESETINKVFENVHKGVQKVSGVTSIFSLMIDALLERSIKKLEELEEDVEAMELLVAKNKAKKALLGKANLVKEHLFFTSKLLRGDLEVIKEIQNSAVPALNLKYFGHHFEDRVLYMQDYVELIKEAVNNVNYLYTTNLSNKMNEQIYRLTIIGALMVIPTIISGFFGMNVPLPIDSFWEISLITFVLLVVSSVILKLLF
ncbi:MAG: hypothetical protein JW791_03930 [Nanoarchaeota archaeon]|nr:hypothetical protein [Nanoarchaeota archaeon]